MGQSANGYSIGARALFCLGVALVAVGGLVFSDAAFAGTGGNEFSNIYQVMWQWITGYLGRTIAIVSFIIGVGLGAVKQNGLIAVSGIMFGALILTIPTVLNTMLNATI